MSAPSRAASKEAATDHLDRARAGRVGRKALGRARAGIKDVHRRQWPHLAQGRGLRAALDARADDGQSLA